MRQPPFEVLCIKKGEWEKSPREMGRPSPAYLQVCTVTKQGQFGSVSPHGNPMEPGLYFQLAEMHPCSGFHAQFFVILPDPSEEVGIQQEHEAIIYQR